MAIKVLLVEDNPADADFLQEMLAMSVGLEWELVLVELREQAIKQLNNEIFDLVLLDLSLPDSQGLDTLISLREVAPNTAMVVMTGLDDEVTALESVRSGAQDYLVKGDITPSLLVRSIRYAIERFQALQKQQDSERRFRAIFEQNFQSTILLSPDGRIVEINQTAIAFSGVSASSVIGRPFWEMAMWQRNHHNQQRLKEAITLAAEGDFIRYEVDLINKRGQVATADFSIKPVRDELGKIVLLIAEARDISDRKRVETEIIKALTRERELSELRAKFVTMVSHEFRTPLSTIILSSGLLESYSQNWSTEKKQIHFQRIQSAVNRMTQLLDDVLLVGKVETGKLDFKPSLMNLRKFCQDLSEELQENDRYQHPIKVKFRGNFDQAKMDEKLLRLILGNLLSNAIKYSPVGSIIKLEIIGEISGELEEELWNQNSHLEEMVLFQVEDCGIGIPEADQQRLFETFHRGENVGNISGTGLGLTIVKRALELHGGKITVKSEVNLGTTFIVTLPKYIENPEEGQILLSEKSMIG